MILNYIILVLSLIALFGFSILIKRFIFYSENNCKQINDYDLFLGLIPVFGDVIDIGNMLWYANDRKWCDAVLSGIAIIPVVGSVFKIGVKNAFKVARLNLNLANKVGKRILSGTPGAAAEFWKLALTNQTFTKEQYELLSAGAKR